MAHTPGVSGGQLDAAPVDRLRPRAHRLAGRYVAGVRIEPFRIAVPDEQLDDLRRRLRATRWPEAETVEDWTQGIPLAYVQEVCRYWGEDYDWRAREAALNRFAQIHTDIDGLDIHAIHVRSPHEN